MDKLTKCDMCGSAIKDGKCSCGTWKDKEEQTEAELHLKGALEAFHGMKQFTLTVDMPHLGVACVYFRGDYKDCKHLEQVLKNMKGRPYYEK